MAATLARSRFSKYFKSCDDHKAYEQPTNVHFSRNHSCTSDAKVTRTPAYSRYSYRDRDFQGVLKRATTTWHMSNLQTCPSRGITPVPLMQKLRTLPRMATTLAAIDILKVF